ncbi:MAG: hypothetical protein IVW57_16485 [Ktedonobacterales bacterium]|nr:hypothetical protein [Ktedonobacterales bacterium]
MPQEAIYHILGIAAIVSGLLGMALIIHDAWVQGRRRREGSAPASISIWSRDAWKDLAEGAALVLGGVGLLLLPAFEGWTGLLIFPLVFLSFVRFLKALRCQRP